MSLTDLQVCPSDFAVDSQVSPSKSVTDSKLSQGTPIIPDIRLYPAVPPIIILSDEDPGFIAAYKTFKEQYADVRMCAFRCHWHLQKDVTKHVACIHGELNGVVHTLFGMALHANSVSLFDKYWDQLTVSVAAYTATAAYFTNTLYPTRNRWASYARKTWRTMKSNASGRVEGQNGLLAEECNKKSSLVDMVRTLNNIQQRQLIQEVTLNGPAKANAGVATVDQDKLFINCLNEVVPYMSTFAYKSMKEQIHDSVKYNANLIASDDETTLVYQVTPRQCCFTDIVDETMGRVVLINIVTGEHTCDCGLMMDMGFVCRHYYLCMATSRTIGIPFNLAMLPRRWLRKDQCNINFDKRQDVYCAGLKCTHNIKYLPTGTPGVTVPPTADPDADIVDADSLLLKKKTALLYELSNTFDYLMDVEKDACVVHDQLSQCVETAFPNTKRNIATGK
jgi:hypothetical protein